MASVASEGGADQIGAAIAHATTSSSSGSRRVSSTWAQRVTDGWKALVLPRFYAAQTAGAMEKGQKEVDGRPGRLVSGKHLGNFAAEESPILGLPSGANSRRFNDGCLPTGAHRQRPVFLNRHQATSQPDNLLRQRVDSISRRNYDSRRPSGLAP